MATIRKEIPVRATTEQVWDVIRDVGAIHTRLAPGFALDTQLEKGARTVKFANGLVARELIVTVDNEAKRLAYAVVGGTAEHHNASFEVFPAEDGGATLVWVSDFLPDTATEAFSAMIEAGASVIKRTLDSSSPR